MYFCMIKMKALLYLFWIPIIILGQTPSKTTVGFIKQVIDQKESNNPFQALHTFQYHSYENLKIAGNPEAITGTSYKKKELKRTLAKTGLYLSEKTSKELFDQNKGRKEIITATLVPGFEQPVLPIFNIKFQSKDLYNNTYYIFDQGYASPLHDDAFKIYNYERLPDSTITGRKVRVIAFSPTTQDINTLAGKLYIDVQTLGIAKAIFYTQGNLDITASHEFTYDRIHNLWYNHYSELYIRKANTVKEIELFGGRFEIGKRKPEEVPDDELYLILKRFNSDFKTNRKVNFGPEGVSTQIEEQALQTPKSYWKTYRKGEPFTTSDLAQFMQLDSIVAAEKITRQLEVIDKFKVGYYPIGIIDIDLKYLIKFNEYEAFRLGIGGTTNDKLSKRWRLGGYVAYGTKDKVWKYKANLSYRLSKKKDTWLHLYKSDDIHEFAGTSFITDARVYSLFEPRLINIPTFYLYKAYGLSMQQRLLPELMSEVALSRKRIEQTTNYQFAADGLTRSNYVLTEATLAARWSPKSDYMQTPSGYQEKSKGYPMLTAQVTKGIKDVVKSDFNYFKFSTKFNYVIERLNNSNTLLQFEGHFAFGDIPLTHLFHANPNAPNKDEILQRFSVAGLNSFETMYFNEFFSDRLFTAQLRHQLPPLKIASWLEPEVVLTSRFAIGSMEQTDIHRNIVFEQLRMGYTESGLEINKLFFGFGISATYRYGAYHLPKFADNLALKFTFYLEI